MKSAAQMKSKPMALDEIKSTHPASSRISSPGGFHRRRRFIPPARVDLVEKPTCRNKSVFLVEAAGIEPVSEDAPSELSTSVAYVFNSLRALP